MRRYLRDYRANASGNDPLWVNIRGEPLAYGGLRETIAYRASIAKIDPPPLHAFRRAFAVSLLRAKVDPYRVMELMGHKDPRTLRHYLKWITDDLEDAHAQGSPADRLHI